MPRNLYERVEVLFPLKDPLLKERITKEILPAYLGDTKKARVLGSDGLYTALRAKRGGGKGSSVQEELMKLAGGHVNGSANSRGRRLAVPYTTGQSATAPTDPAVTLELEAEDSSNATV
jgi:hypothetical protein